METQEKSTDAEGTAAKNPRAEQEQPKAKTKTDRKELFKRLLVRRLVLCVVVALVALVVWKVKYSKPVETTEGPVQGERVHMAVNYASFLNDEKIILPFSGEVYVGLRLAKAYPSGSSICFRFDAYLRVKEDGILSGQLLGILKLRPEVAVPAFRVGEVVEVVQRGVLVEPLK